MEILQKFKQNGYFTADLYHLLAERKIVDVPEEITPSKYEKELKMSTAERLQNLHHIVVDNIVSNANGAGAVTLSFTPRIIIFQNFKPNDKIIAKFSVKNISKAPTFLNMVYKESSYFCIRPYGGQLLSRLAPGISVTFSVTFQPVQYEDYTHKVTFFTDIDEYILPLIAMGPRPVFNFPDQIVLPTIPLKVENHLMVTIHNVGMVPAGFTLTTRCPFSVQPKSAYLNPNQNVSIRVGFKTMYTGEAKGVLHALFETGETFRINLIGSAHLVSIELERQVVRFPDTYNTMVRQQTLKIVNKSNHLLTYACMKNDCVYNDFEDKVKLGTMFCEVKDVVSAKDNKLVYYDVLSSDEHERVFTRILYDQIQALVADESLYFKHTHFSISPITGKIWPNQSTELTVTFSPSAIGEFEATSYLDIDGVYERLPLRMAGASMPPLIMLNVETLDMDRVYINKTYNYEIVAKNKGHISGMIVYKEVPPLFGSIISCSPAAHCLLPGRIETFVISFRNSNQGPFFEEINFFLRHTAVVLKVYLKGVVIYPSLTFNVPCLDFGMVSVGVPKTLQFEVINESVVQVDASVKISSDGPEISSITLQDYSVANKPKPRIPQWPREFNIVPDKISIGPESTITLQVTLTANLVRANQTSLDLELDKSDSSPIVLPVTFNAMIPHITPVPDIKLRASFLGFPYKRELNISCNDFWGYFTLDDSEDTTLEVEVGVKEGFIEPNSVLILPVTIKTEILGEQDYVLRLNVFGSSKPVEVCRITATGVRPIITCSPTALHWGQVKLLTKNQKSITLCNDSPVVIDFKVSLLNRDGRWIISPTEGQIAPESESDLIFSLYLIDADTYSNKAIIQMEKIKDLIVPLSATGVGTSILVGDHRDKILLGKHFTKIPLNCKITMENCGTRLHALEWSEHYKAPKTKQHVTAFFTLEPKVFKIASGEKLELTVSGLSHKVTSVREKWYLVGSVEGINKKELLLDCEIFAEFVDPKIELSSLAIDFRYDYGPYSEHYKLTDVVTIKNVSKLPLDFDISTRPPFAIIQKSTYKVSQNEQNFCGCISYNDPDVIVTSFANEQGPHHSKILIDYLTQSPVEVHKKSNLYFFEDINKMKGAFNLIHGIEERLEDQEALKIQVLFDTSKHVSLKSRVYSDSMKIKFKGHKNKDAIKLIGTINFPNVLILTPKVDFQCILNGSIESKTIKIQNITPLLVCYRFNWKSCSISMQNTIFPQIPDSCKPIIKSRFSTAEPNALHAALSCISPDISLGDQAKCENGAEEFLKNSPPLTMQHVYTKDIENEKEAMKRKVIKRVWPIINTKFDLNFEWAYKLSKDMKQNNIGINDVLQLMPHRGLLKPNETQYVHVIFKPPTDVMVRATLECEVLGGPTESISISGHSSDLSHAISTKKINFKIRSFHENATEKLILSNKALLSYQYNTYLNEPKFENDFYMTILRLIPCEKNLEPNENVDIIVEVRPGIMGYFHRTFLLEVGHLPLIPIEVFGWGVIPQVFLILPRTGISKRSRELGYEAICTLTVEYLDAISDIFAKDSAKCESEHLNSPATEKCFIDPMFQDNWYICSLWDEYPTAIDIELAIERTLVKTYIKEHPDVLNVYATTTKMVPIPGFYTSPYLIDFGVVITGSTIHIPVTVINYGPIPTKLHFAKGTHIPPWLGVKLCGKLNPGESGKIEVTFAPNSNDFKELEQNVETSFNIEVSYGVTIPVHIRSLCAVPYLFSNVKSINLGSVRCGDKIIYSIPLKNVGRPTCVWFASLKLRTPGPSPMAILTSSGKYDPDEGGWLSIAFKPIIEMAYEAVLIFKFHMNPNRMTIPICGQGILPQVHVIGPNVTFPPTLPWADTTHIYFGLTNPCPFPIEVIIAHDDLPKWKEEEEIYQLLHKYYNKPEEMVVPALKPGAGLPANVLNFNQTFKDTVKRLTDEEFQASKARPPSTVRKSKSPKTTAKSTVAKETVSPRKMRTEVEISADVMKKMKEADIDPLKDCLNVMNVDSVDRISDTYSKGIIIFFHGSPCEEMQYQEMAYSTGKSLNIPTINIDNCIVDALCNGTSTVKVGIMNAINDLYEASRRSALRTESSKSNSPKTNSDENDTCTDDRSEETDDPFEMIRKKVVYLANAKNVATPRSKLSDKKKKKSPTSSLASHSGIVAPGSTTIFQLELIQELLADYFKQRKFDKGFVVDTLTSLVIKSPPLVLTTVLKSKHTISNIHLVLYELDFNKWALAYEDSVRENDLVDDNASRIYDETEINNIVQCFDEMDDSEYEEAHSELKNVYITYGLETRRKKYFERKGLSYETIVKSKSIKDCSRSLLAVDGNESKKKIKREDNKLKQNSEYLMMNTKYNDYMKNVYENLINIANNWVMEECEIGYPIYNFNGQVIGSTHKKVRKKSEIQLQPSDVSFSARGFPLTLVICPCQHYKNALLHMFLSSSVVQEALKEEIPPDILQFSPTKKEYSVLLPKYFPVLKHEEPLQWKYLDEEPIMKCECNQLTDLHLLDDANQDNVLNIISKWHCICGKKMASSQTSTSEIPSTSVETTTMGSTTDVHSVPLYKIKSLTSLKPRIILNPGDLVRCKYSFNPQIEGHFNLKRFVEVSGWPDSRVEINVSAICDMPRLDSRPKKMFENFVRRTAEDRVYKITFLDDQKLFEFGPIFIGAHRVYEEKCAMMLKNTSLITTNIEIEFLADNPIFQIDKNIIVLEPGCKGDVWISAAPTEVGVHKCVLLFCVGDNPEVITLDIACSGVVPSVEILPLTKTIEYGKHLLYRRESERFIVKNDSILPIMWKLKNPEDFVADFIIAQLSGVVLRGDNHVVPLTYIACRVGVISNRPLVIDIYDAEGRGEPMLTDVLLLSAECYDVMVECAHENPNENFLNYGNVKVNSTVVREMYLLNRGKYSIFYKLKKVKNFPEPSLLRSFEALPDRGVIPASLKLVSIEFECTPSTSMNLVNVPAYMCSLLDGSKDQVVVAKFPICVTIASFYNTFTLFPLGELNFHIIAVGSGVMREVILNNTSKCPFTFDIVLPLQYRIDPNDPPPAPKMKDNKLKSPPLKCGNFLIFNDDNLLAPGTSRTLQIQFLATSAKTFEETIEFIVSDTCPAEAKGVPLKLVGTGAMPTLDFWNVETTFREHLIVRNLTEYKVPESFPHCVFVEDTVTLYFFCVNVNTSHVAVIDLYNNGMVACALNMKLHYQTNSNQEIFSLDKYKTHIEPLLHKNLGIIFSPKALKEYRAVLEIKLKLLDNQEQSFKICLIGEGVIPRIQIVSPSLRHQNLALLQFPITCLGSISHKEVRFENVTSVRTLVVADVSYPVKEERPIFWITSLLDASDEEETLHQSMNVMLQPGEVATVYVHFNPIKRGRTTCDVTFTICENPFEHFTVLCEAESFMEDVVLLGLEMLSMDIDLDAYKNSVDGTISTVSTADSRKKSKSGVPSERRKLKTLELKHSKKHSQLSMKHSDTNSSYEHSTLKYILDFGGCELFHIQKRSVLMVNNSEKVYKFKWAEVDCIVVKPLIGYISPGEEKDLEIMFYSPQPTVIKKEFLYLELSAISDEFFTINNKGASWDSRQTITVFEHNKDVKLNERIEAVIDEQNNPNVEALGLVNHIVVVYSAMTAYTKYTCTLPEEVQFDDTFIYQTRCYDFKVENIGKVAMKIAWSFVFDEEFPTKIEKSFDNDTHYLDSSGNCVDNEAAQTSLETQQIDSIQRNETSKVTLFSDPSERTSVDTWFEVDLPFKIEPDKQCLKPNETRQFRVTFSPSEAFLYNVRLKSVIDNLDPYDLVISTKIRAKSLIPYVHLDIEDSDYLTSGRRKVTGVALPPHMTVLEFNVLGWGCYKKNFNVVNPTAEGYEFIFEMVMSDNTELVPVHCDMLKGYVDGGTFTEATFTFAPTAPGVYESQWKFIIPVHGIVMNLLVVGIVREPEIAFLPTILIIRNSLVGFTTKHEVLLKNNESANLNFEFRGNSLTNESGKTPVIVNPERGILKARSETPISITYTPIQDGPLSFKIFCNVAFLTKMLTLCVNALSHSIRPKVLYYLIGNEHVLNNDAITHIHLDQTASTYQRTLPFTVKNEGSATFFFDWRYTTSSVKKYLQVYVEPCSGHVAPGDKVECVLYFTLKEVPVQAFPVTLFIPDGPEYSIMLHAKIDKPLYHFSCMEFDFGKCITNAPDATYKKNIAFENDDKVPLILNLDFANLPELYVQHSKESTINPGKRFKISIFFRPKQVKEYEFRLHFSVNSLCKEVVTVRGEGIPLLFDLYEGCQKSFDLGPVKLGEKIVRQIEVMNHSKVPIEASFIFRDMYPTLEDTANSEATSVCLSPSSTKVPALDAGPSRGKMLQQYKDGKVEEQIAMDIQNALSSLKAIPTKCTIRPYRKVPLKIQFKPVGLIKDLNVQLNMKVFEFERPLVRLSGSATGMSLCLSQNSLQFGRVRRRGCKILKVMLLNKGDFGAGFWWQPLISDEFTISPMHGNVAAHTNVTFTITFRPANHNPFIKVWASCNIENYKPLELAMYASCVDFGNVQNKTLYLECPVREVHTDYITVTNPSDDVWLVLSEVSGGPFETLREFNIEPNSTFDIPIHFKPKNIGKHECQVLFSPLGESALFITLQGMATHPNPNGTINVTVPAKDIYTKDLPVYNITEFPESYKVSTELVKVVPEKFEGYYEIKYPDTVKVWGEAAATCRWTFACYEECEMTIKVYFINEASREYQYYNIEVVVAPARVLETLTFVSRARESVLKELVISNPLSVDAIFTVRCDKLECPDSLKISRNSEATLSMVFSPLVVGETHDYLEVSNNHVGTYVYGVVLKCLPAKEKDLEFTTTLGSSVPLRLRVHNKTDARTDFKASVSCPSITTDKEYSLGPHEKGKLLARFEPTELGVQMCRVSFDSPIAGEFVFNIKGIALAPKPQGPFQVKAGGFVTIMFKNIFEDTRMFKIHVDREEFNVKTLYEPVKPKKELAVTVFLSERPPRGWPKPPTGCLVIETYEPPEPKVQWIYFLQGLG